MGRIAPHLERGQRGEDAALAAYLRAGYRLVARNWRCPLGELDLILLRGQTLVFCEVKARRATGLGGPHEAVTRTKQRKLRQLADAFLTDRPFAADRLDVRFDVASVMIRPGGAPSVHLFEDCL
jgi:putative endonuclease